MDTPSSDVVAVLDQVLGLNEPALKQIAVLFNRIAFPGLSAFKSLPETPFKFGEHLLRLADTGILFEPKIEKSDDQDYKNRLLRDVDELFKPAGVSAEDLLASRNDEKKALEVREKTRSLGTESTLGNDPFAVFSAIQRLMTNMTRVTAIQLRNLNHLDAHAVLSSEVSPLEQVDEHSNAHDVLQIIVPGLPLPDQDVSWEQIFEYRSDPNSLNRFLDFRSWISDIARGNLTPLEAEQRLEGVLKRFRKQMEIRRMKTVSTTFEVVITASPDAIRNLVSYPQGTKLCFFAQRKLSLLKGEGPSEVSEVAFVLGTTFLPDKLNG